MYSNSRQPSYRMSKVQANYGLLMRKLTLAKHSLLPIIDGILKVGASDPKRKVFVLTEDQYKDVLLASQVLKEADDTIKISKHGIFSRKTFNTSNFLFGLNRLNMGDNGQVYADEYIVIQLIELFKALGLIMIDLRETSEETSSHSFDRMHLSSATYSMRNFLNVFTANEYRDRGSSDHRINPDLAAKCTCRHEPVHTNAVEQQYSYDDISSTGSIDDDALVSKHSAQKIVVQCIQDLGQVKNYLEGQREPERHQAVQHSPEPDRVKPKKTVSVVRPCCTCDSKSGGSHPKTSSSKAKTSSSQTNQSPSKTKRSSSKTKHSGSKTDHSTSETDHSDSKPKHSSSKTKHSSSKTKHSSSKTKHSSSKTKHSKSKTKHSSSNTKQPDSKTDQTASKPKKCRSRVRKCCRSRSNCSTKKCCSRTKQCCSKTKQCSSKTKQCSSKTKQCDSKTDHSASEPKHSIAMTRRSSSKTKHSNSKPKHSDSKTKHSTSQTKHPDEPRRSSSKHKRAQSSTGTHPDDAAAQCVSVTGNESLEVVMNDKNSEGKLIISIKGKTEDDGDIQIVVKQCPNCDGGPVQSRVEEGQQQTEEYYPEHVTPCGCEMLTKPCGCPEDFEPESEDRGQQATDENRDLAREERRNQKRQRRKKHREENFSQTHKPSRTNTRRESPEHSESPVPPKLNVIFNAEDPSNSIVESPEDHDGPIEQEIRLNETVDMRLKTNGGEAFIISVGVKPAKHTKGSATEPEPEPEPIHTDRKKRGSPTIKIELSRAKICSSMDCDVTRMNSKLRTSGVQHRNDNVAMHLRHMGPDNLLRACRPVHCGRDFALNQKTQKSLPYTVSLKSLPLDEEDLDIIDKSLEMSLNKIKHDTIVLKAKPVKKLHGSSKMVPTNENIQQVYFLKVIHPMIVGIKRSSINSYVENVTMKNILQFYINLEHDLKPSYKHRVYQVTYFETWDGNKKKSPGSGDKRSKSTSKPDGMFASSIKYLTSALPLLACNSPTNSVTKGQSKSNAKSEPFKKLHYMHEKSTKYIMPKPKIDFQSKIPVLSSRQARSLSRKVIKNFVTESRTNYPIETNEVELRSSEIPLEDTKVQGYQVEAVPNNTFRKAMSKKHRSRSLLSKRSESSFGNKKAQGYENEVVTNAVLVNSRTLLNKICPDNQLKTLQNSLEDIELQDALHVDSSEEVRNHTAVLRKNFEEIEENLSVLTKKEKKVCIPMTQYIEKSGPCLVKSQSRLSCDQVPLISTYSGRHEVREQVNEHDQRLPVVRNLPSKFRRTIEITNSTTSQSLTVIDDLPRAGPCEIRSQSRLSRDQVPLMSAYSERHEVTEHMHEQDKAIPILTNLRPLPSKEFRATIKVANSTTSRSRTEVDGSSRSGPPVIRSQLRLSCDQVPLMSAYSGRHETSVNEHAERIPILRNVPPLSLKELHTTIEAANSTTSRSRTEVDGLSMSGPSVIRSQSRLSCDQVPLMCEYSGRHEASVNEDAERISILRNWSPLILKELHATIEVSNNSKSRSRSEVDGLSKSGPSVIRSQSRLSCDQVPLLSTYSGRHEEEEHMNQHNEAIPILRNLRLLSLKKCTEVDGSSRSGSSVIRSQSRLSCDQVPLMSAYSGRHEACVNKYAERIPILRNLPPLPLKELHSTIEVANSTTSRSRTEVDGLSRSGPPVIRSQSRLSCDQVKIMSAYSGKHEVREHVNEHDERISILRNLPPLPLKELRTTIEVGANSTNARSRPEIGGSSSVIRSESRLSCDQVPLMSAYSGRHEVREHMNDHDGRIPILRNLPSLSLKELQTINVGGSCSTSRSRIEVGGWSRSGPSVIGSQSRLSCDQVPLMSAYSVNHEVTEHINEHVQGLPILRDLAPLPSKEFRRTIEVATCTTSQSQTVVDGLSRFLYEFFIRKLSPIAKKEILEIISDRFRNEAFCVDSNDEVRGDGFRGGCDYKAKAPKFTKEGYWRYPH